MNRARKLLVPSLLTGALLAALVLAASASAEIRVGEATAAPNPALNPQADITAARAEYNSETGAVTFKLTTVAPPTTEIEGKASNLSMVAALASPSTCGPAATETGAFPVFDIQYQYAQPEFVPWLIVESAESEPKFPETVGLASASTSGTTTTLAATAPKAANRGFNCAVAGALNGNTPEGEFHLFAIAVPPPPPAPPAPAPVPPAPVAPAALSIAKLKPVQLKVGKWKTVRIKVADTGGSSTAPGSLQLKAPKGVLVKPQKQKLPVLTAGGTWTVSAKVQVTAKAKKKSTVKLTATAGSATAKGSLVLKRQG